ncbi:MAG: FtsH protease activity modulator HflK [Gammaproteobacteria bacterium]|jgi:membrane protease subunit HflK|nr:FtsH protease activity modulator HflK [Gammaproteobacteria bacterium]
MAWNEPGGDKDRDPWRSGDNDKGPPDLDEIVRNLQEKFGGLFGGRSRRPSRGNGNGSDGGGSGGGGGQLPRRFAGFGINFLLVIAVAAWVLSGIYIIDEGKRGVVLRFGKFLETTQPGPHWRPRFIDEVEVVDVEARRFVEIGYRSGGRQGGGGTVLRESLMLTEDENIVDLQLAVQYQVSDARDFLFNVRDPVETLFSVSESAIREVVGKDKMDFVLTEGRSEVVAETKTEIQKTLDIYQTGIVVTNVNLRDAQPPEEVQASFEDAIKAREDEQRLKNEAEAYANEVVPKARGEAARILEESVAYRDQVIAAAEGEASRFTQVLAEYEKAPEVTRERLYIESLESVLSNSTKIMLDVDSGNNLMVLPLEQLLSGRVGDVIESTPAELDRQKQAQTQVVPRSTRDTSRNRGAR